MAHMFTYIKPESMISAFNKQKDTVLKERSICVARLGDLAVNMSYVNDDAFTLSLEDLKYGTQYSGRVINVDVSDEKDAAEMVEGFLHRMQMIHDQEVLEMREHIWKWYGLKWLEEQGITLDEYLDNIMSNEELKDKIHWKSFEEYIASDYLNVADTMNLISEFALTEEENNIYSKFIASDIIELRQSHSFETLKKQFDHEDEVFENKKSFTFGVEVVADSREEARKKLQAILADEEDGDFYIIG